MNKQPNFKSYLVGGAVRDIIMGREPKDRDYVVIGETPESMIAAGFTQVGADFPVFLHPETKEEYALARKERKTGDGYLGFECEFGSDVTIEEDLARRDFVMNSMAMDSDGTIIDPFGGQLDIKNRLIRHTSNAFSDDPLRVIRTARFVARYGFTVATHTIQLIKEMVLAGELNHLPYERFYAEIEKVLKDEDSNLIMFFGELHRYGFSSTQISSKKRCRGLRIITIRISSITSPIWIFCVLKWPMKIPKFSLHHVQKNCTVFGIHIRESILPKMNMQ